MHLAVRTIDFDYPLPEELIADRPLPDRAASRMLVLHRDTGLMEHRHFCDLPEYVRPGDHFILNDTRVVPARYFPMTVPLRLSGPRCLIPFCGSAWCVRGAK